jgi:hypothetical protein
LHRLALAFSVFAAITLGVPASAQTQAPTAPAAGDTAAAPASAEPIGNVAALTGTVTVIRDKNSLPLKLRDDIFLNDVVQTSADSSLGITFDDGTTFRLSANAKITIDNYVYEDGGKQNAATFNIGRGTVAFVAASVAKTGDMKIDTPTATLGIRGTTGLVEVPDNVSAARSSAGNVAIKLYPDNDGHVGRIEVNDHTGASLGALTRGASGFSIRGGAAGGAMRFAAVPLTIAPRDLQRDQGFVRQVHSAQTLGRQIVTEQRAFRRANPAAAPNRGNPQAPQRPNSAPGQNNNRQNNDRQNNNRLNNNRPGQQPPATTPDRRGQRDGQRQGQSQPLPRAPQQPGARPPQPPTQARPSDVQQARPQLQRPGSTARPMQPPRGRPALPPRDRRRERQPR